MAWSGHAILVGVKDLIINRNASRLDWGAVCDGVRKGSLWSHSLHVS